MTEIIWTCSECRQLFSSKDPHPCIDPGRSLPTRSAITLTAAADCPNCKGTGWHVDIRNGPYTKPDDHRGYVGRHRVRDGALVVIRAVMQALGSGGSSRRRKR